MTNEGRLVSKPINQKEAAIRSVLEKNTPSSQREIASLCAEQGVFIAQSSVSDYLTKLNLNRKIGGVYTLKTETEELLELLIKTKVDRCSTFIKAQKGTKCFGIIHFKESGDENVLCRYLKSVFELNESVLIPAYGAIMLIGYMDEINPIITYIESIKNPKKPKKQNETKEE